MAGWAAFPLPACCGCSACWSPQDLVLAVPKPFGHGTHQQSMSLPKPVPMPLSAEVSSLYHGYRPERDVQVSVHFVQQLETYKQLPCHFCPHAAGTQHRVQHLSPWRVAWLRSRAAAGSPQASCGQNFILGWRAGAKHHIQKDPRQPHL